MRCVAVAALQKVDGRLGSLGQVNEIGIVPHGEHSSTLAGPVGMGGVEHSAVAHNQITGLQRHVDLTLRLLEGDVLRIGIRSEFIRMLRRGLVVQRVTLAVRPRYHPQATVFHGCVGQIVHQETLDRLRGIADRIIPETAVLVPEKRRAVGRLADDPAMPEFGLGEA